MQVLIELGRPLIRHGNATFIYHDDLSKWMKVEGAFSEDIFDYLFDIRVRKLLSEKGKKYLHELFKKWDAEHLQLDEDFGDYSDNDGDIIGDEGMQNLNMDD